MKKLNAFIGILIFTVITVGCASGGKNKPGESVNPTGSHAEQSSESGTASANTEVYVFKKLSDAEKENFRDLLERNFGSNVSDLSIENSQSDIMPDSAKWYNTTVDFRFEGTLNKAGENCDFRVTENFGSYEETVAGKDYLCIYFGVKSNSNNHRFTGVSVTDYGENSLSVDIKTRQIEDADMALTSDIVILRFDRAVLGGDVNEFNVSFSLD